jgi:hypothetical protein
MIDLQTVLTYLTLISVPVGVAYHIMTLNNTRKNQQLQLETRKAQLVSRLREMFWDIENGLIVMELLEMEWTDFDDFLSKYDSTVNQENYAKRFKIWGQLQEVGYLIHEEIIDVESVYNLWGGHNSLIIWEKFKSIIYEQRKFYKDPSWFRWFEYYGEEMKKYRQKQGISPDIHDPDGYVTRP